MTEAPSPRSTRTAGWPKSLLLASAALILLVLGFSVASSLAAAVSENRWWLLGCGLTVCVVLPALVGSWIRSIRRRGDKAGVKPSTVSVIAATNALLVVGGVVLAPATTAAQLRRHGSWWVESIVRLAGKGQDSSVVVGAERTFNWLAGLLPGGDDAEVGSNAGVVPTARDGLGAVARSTPDDGSAADRGAVVVTTVPDSGGRPALPGEVRLRFERRGAAVIVPVTLHGPSSSVAVQMLFDTGASLVTLNDATLRRLGVFVSPGDPTIETHTANGTARRVITTIEGVTLDTARIDGGLTVALCEPCAKNDVVGLLGLNVLRHFVVTLDDEAGQVVLRRRRAGSPQGDLADIRPFVVLHAPRGVWRGPMLTVTARLENRAPRGLRYVKLAAVVKQGEREGRIWGEVRDVPARGTMEVRLEGLSPLKGERFELLLERADW